MKTLRYTFVLSAAVLALSACTQNDLADGTNLPEGEYPLVIKTTGVKDAASRATVDGNWDGVTDVALQVGAEVKKYSVSASGANKESAILSSTDPFYWTSRENITVTAWWPYNAADLSMPEVKVNADQSSLENFKSSDYIYAHSDAVEFENPTLEFTHRTARVTVTLVEGKGVTSLEGASVSLNGLDTEHENPASVTPYKVSDGFTYDALVAPQTIAQGAAFISVQLNGGTYSYLPDAAIELAAGSRYNYTVKVNAKGLELVGCTITDWTTMGNEKVDADYADYSYNASTDTYTVFTAEGLYAWAEHVNAGNYSTNCILANDIVMPAVTEGESNWTPKFYYYHGTFDGQNHTISGIVIDESESSEVYVGLFRSLYSDGTVKNLGLVDIDIIDGYTAGGIVGYNLGVVSSCYTIGNIEGDEEAGGIVGLNFGEITSCYTTANIQGDMRTGGIVGDNEDKIIACYSAGQIQGNHVVGGIAGVNFDEIMACYSTGNIRESVPLPPMEDEHFIRDYCAGGVAGMNVGEIRACYTTGDIEGTYVGGISGVNQNPMTPEDDIRGRIENCYWSGNCDYGAWYRYPGDYHYMEKVGRVNTWETATISMNEALAAENSEWRYVQGEDKTLPPTLQKNQ